MRLRPRWFAGSRRGSDAASRGGSPDPATPVRAVTGSGLDGLRVERLARGETGIPMGMARPDPRRELGTAIGRDRRPARANERCPRQLPTYSLANAAEAKTNHFQALREAGATGLEPATSGVTGRRSNQLSYAPSRGTFKYGKRNSSAPAATLRVEPCFAHRNRSPGGRAQPGRGRVVGISDGDPGSGSPSWLRAVALRRRHPATEDSLELQRDGDRDVVPVVAGGDLDPQRQAA